MHHNKLCYHSYTIHQFIKNKQASLFTNLIFKAYLEVMITVLPRNQSFESFYDCSAKIHSFILERDNWGSPFIEAPPGCPQLDTDGDFLTDGGSEWRCL